MKKIISILLAIVLMTAMATVAFAADEQSVDDILSTWQQRADDLGLTLEEYIAQLRAALEARANTLGMTLDRIPSSLKRTPDAYGAACSRAWAHAG